MFILIILPISGVHIQSDNDSLLMTFWKSGV